MVVVNFLLCFNHFILGVCACSDKFVNRYSVEYLVIYSIGIYKISNTLYSQNCKTSLIFAHFYINVYTLGVNIWLSLELQEYSFNRFQVNLHTGHI